MAFEIARYVRSDGNCPVAEWFATLAPAIQMRVSKAIAKVECGNFGNCRSITGGEGVCEIRMDFGPGYRLYYGIDGATIILLLCGGDKSTQRRDIEKAKEYWREYRS